MSVRSTRGRLTTLALALTLGLATAAPAAASPWSDLLGRLGTWFSDSAFAALWRAQHARLGPAGRPNSHQLISNEGVVVDPNGRPEGSMVDPNGRPSRDPWMSDEGEMVDPNGVRHN